MTSKTPGTETPGTETPAAPVLDLASLEHDVEAKFTAAEVHVPAEIKAFVDKAHEFWRENPKKWRAVTLGSENAVKEAVKLATRYSKATERTFRLKKTGDTSRLVYKVTDQVHKGADKVTPPGSDEASND